MSGLKSFLYGVSPIIGVSPAALYERQRALVKLGLLEVAPGRGPGSGVGLSAGNVAAMIVCVLATDGLSEVDERVVDLCNAPPDISTIVSRSHWTKSGKPTFRSEIARLLAGEKLQMGSTPRLYRGIRVSRCWRGQIMHGIGSLQSKDFFVNEDSHWVPSGAISITAEIESDMLGSLMLFTRGALSQVVEEGDEE
jgi:hypothetical protein